MKKYEKNSHIVRILEMFIAVMNDLFINLIENKNMIVFSQNVNNLIDYTNENITKINKRYKSNAQTYFIRKI